MARVFQFSGVPLRSAIIALALGILFVPETGMTQSPQAPTFTVLYSFPGDGHGADPIALLPEPDGVVYGTAADGGCSSCGGLVFKLTSAGTEYVLHLFAGKSDGLFPVAGLVRDPYGNLYGTTLNGGGSTACQQGCGVVFEVNQWGTETVIHRFAGGFSDGANPHGPLVLDTADDLYGTTLNGGQFGYGTVFMVDRYGAETVLYNFTGGTDGGNPSAGLVRDSDGNLYGTTVNGGVNYRKCELPMPGCGTVFMVDRNGTEKVLYSFTGRTDGRNPMAGLVRDSEGNLYGTTVSGGDLSTFSCSFPGPGCGTVFMLDKQGKETVLHSFTGKADGGDPYAGLVRDSAGNLYGTTIEGGISPGGDGVVFELSPAGEETILHNFTGGDDGEFPIWGGLTQDAAGNLYGTTETGGVNGAGVAFKIHP